MAMKYLGETLDIHTGGIDLAFPHHENEIASERGARRASLSRGIGCMPSICLSKARRCRSRREFLHAPRFVCEGLQTFGAAVCSGQCPYRKQLNFTFDGLQQAASSVERLRNFAIG